MITAD